MISNKEFIERLERIKLAKKLTWAEAAKLVGLSRAMVGFIRQRKHPVSVQVARNLSRAEREAGIIPVAKAIIEAIAARSREMQIKVSSEDLEAGIIVAKLDYLTGRPPAGCPDRISLSRPDIKISAKLITAVLLEESYHPVLLACLPREFANKTFLNRLTPFCYNELAEAAMALVFGQNWQERLPDLPR